MAKRTIRLEKPAYVYDLRAKKALGNVSEFTVALAAAQAKFFAALPYEVGDVAVTAQGATAGAEVKVAVSVALPAGAKACHPVLVEVYDPAGKKSRLYSGVCDAKGGTGTYAFRTALNDPTGTWRVVATDYITGKTASASFAQTLVPSSSPCIFISAARVFCNASKILSLSESIAARCSFCIFAIIFVLPDFLPYCLS